MRANIPARDAALVRAQDRRLAIDRIRQRARAGEVTLAELLHEPPPEFKGWMCIDVVCLAWTRRHSTAALERLGRLAVRDGINLLIPLGRASLRTRKWIAQHVVWCTSIGPTGGQRLRVGLVNGNGRPAPVDDEDEAA